jgi:hypothetical protein
MEVWTGKLSQDRAYCASVVGTVLKIGLHKINFFTSQATVDL